MTDTTQNPDMDMELAPDRETDALALGRSPTDTGPAVTGSIRHGKKRVPDSSYENYLFGKAGSEDRPSWSDSMHGRAAIRLVSRGIVGAAFFTIGGRVAKRQLEGYNEKQWQWDSNKPLQAIAKGIDYTFGNVFKKGIELAARGIGKTEQEAKYTAEHAMTFRHTRDFTVLDSQGRAKLESLGVDALGHEIVGPGRQKFRGRSYGNEVVSFTFDFAMASVGDALTRNLARVIDPNVKKSWLVNDKGEEATRGEHKHFVFSKWLKSSGSAAWTIFSKNQGEDWAAAIPYAFQMKFQSKLLNSAFVGKRAGGKNRFEGHDIAFEEGFNGGAYRRAPDPTTGKMRIVGDAQLPGAIDLHLRFVGYNWYTLMWRETHDFIGNHFNQWKQDGFAIHAPQLPQHFNPLTSTVDGLATAGRYLTKSFIKANMYMNPAVVPFWFLRASQSKWQGNYIDEVGGKMELSKLKPANPYAAENYAHYPRGFETGFSKVLNKVGEVQCKIGNKAGDLANHYASKKLADKPGWIEKLATVGMQKDYPDRAERLMAGRKKMMHEYTDAAIAYTPYMFAKAEFGLRVDDNKGDGKPGQMDMAIYRFMDNVAAFNGHATWKSLKEMWKLGTHFEEEAVMREGGPEPKSIVTQTMPSNATPTAGEDKFMDNIAKSSGYDSWQTMKAARPAADKIPTTTVAAGNVMHEPANLSRRASDKQAAEEKSWVQSVKGDSVNPAQVMSAGVTLH